MKAYQVSRRSRTDAGRRAQLLAAFDRSELSAADFARQQGLNYTTFCGWRQRRDQAKPVPAFVEVEVAANAAPVALVIEVGALARMRIESEPQMALAAGLLRKLAARSC